MFTMFTIRIVTFNDEYVINEMVLTGLQVPALILIQVADVI
jgi:hypothetical protein